MIKIWGTNKTEMHECSFCYYATTNYDHYVEHMKIKHKLNTKRYKNIELIQQKNPIIPSWKILLVIGLIAFLGYIIGTGLF